LENSSRQQNNPKQQENGNLRTGVNLLFLLNGSCKGGVEVDEKKMIMSKNQSE
jgi:hypothetical protein